MRNIYERIVAFNQGRLPEMVNLKFEGMAENIYRFYRGTCHLFYEDLCKSDHFPASPPTWICGDLHLENYGSYKGDNRLAYFDLNDFDEGLLAPCLWEIARMVTSIFIAFENLGIKEDKAVKMAQFFLKSYAARMATGKAISIDPRTASGIVCAFLTKADERKQKYLVNRLTIKKKHKLSFLTNERHFLISDKKQKKELSQFIDGWMESSAIAQNDYKVIDCVFRVAGTGSIGVKRFLFLLKNQNVKNKFLLLDMKQAMHSSVQPYLDIPQPEWQNEAIRVVQIKNRMQYVVPALLGTGTFQGDTYVIQEMQPTADRINFELIKDKYDAIRLVIEDMALLAASSQLRSSGRQGSAIADQLMAFGSSDHWQGGTLDYSKKYAAKVKDDFQQYLMAYKAQSLENRANKTAG